MFISFLHKLEPARVTEQLEDHGVAVHGVSFANSVNAQILARALGAMNRELYRAMFSLDDETTEKGGDDILAAFGDLVPGNSTHNHSCSCTGVNCPGVGMQTGQ